MDTIPEKYEARNQKTMELVTETFDFKNVDDAPIIIKAASIN